MVGKSLLFYSYVLRDLFPRVGDALKYDAVWALRLNPNKRSDRLWPGNVPGLRHGYA